MEMDFELIWWLALLIGAILAAALGPALLRSSGDYIDDLPAWTRNYERIQRRH